MKRFYKLVSTQETNNGYLIMLDGRAVKTAMKEELLASTEALANALVLEWSGQEEEIVPDSMPLTQILSTKIDRVAKERSAMEEILFKYVDTDLLCYRTDHPPELQTAQEEAWDGYLEWFENEHGANLETTHAITALTQSAAAHDAIQSNIKSLSDDHFTVLQLVSSSCGSLVLGLAALVGKANADELYAAIRVEEKFKAEIYNEEFYGGDPAQEQKDKAIQADLKSALEYLELLS
jgi:chaperone required for assembly of F1-ATPase